MAQANSIRQSLSAKAIDIISDSILWFDSNWKILDANKSFLRSYSGNIPSIPAGNQLNTYFSLESGKWDELWKKLEKRKDVVVDLSLNDNNEIVKGTFRLTSVEKRNVGMLILSAADQKNQEVFDDMMLQSIIDLSPAHINYYDADLNFLCVNKGFLEDFDLTKEDVIGKPVFDVVGQYMEAFSEQLQRDIEFRKGGEFSVRHTLPGVKESRYYHGIYEPHFSADDSLLGYTMVVMDMTSQKSTEEALRESESKLKLSLSVSQTAIFDFNIETGESTASDNLYEILGFKPQEFKFTLEKWQSMVHPDDMDLAVSQFREYLDSQRENYRSEYRMLRNDGSYQWMSLIGKTIDFDSKGNPGRILGMIRNIHFRRQIEEGMRCLIESKNDYSGVSFFEDVTKKLSELLSVRYTAIAIREENNEDNLQTLALWDGEKLIPYFKYPIKGSPCEIIYNNAEQVYVSSDLCTKFPGDAFIVDRKLESYYGIPFFNAANEILGHLFIMDDNEFVFEEWVMSLMKIYASMIGDELERMQKENALEELNQSLETQVELRTNQLESAINELDTFFYRASHDLRGPITTLKGISSLMADEVSASPHLNQYTEMFCAQIDRMNALNASIIEVGTIRQWEVKAKEIDFRKAVNSILDDLTIPEGIKIFIDLNHTHVIRTDEELLTKVIGFIIENSLIHRESEPGFIKVVSQDTTKGITISIEDDGVGMPDEASEAVFGMFFRGNMLGDGFGLGLYKAKMASDKLGISIEIGSNPSAGTATSLSIPLAV